jgi:hypothetical protein
MSFVTRSPLTCLLLAASLLAASGGNAWSEAGSHAQPRNCPDAGATVVGADTADFADICSGVASALKFFASHDLRPNEPVSVEVTRSIPPEAGPTAAGCYLENRRRVFVLPYSAFRKSKTWFGVSINREIYRTLAAHEAAHAIAACNFRIPNPTIQAKEYLAYVAMFSAMPPRLRTQALRATPTVGFDSLDRFTSLLYMFDPMRFGAEAHRHFNDVTDQTELIRAVLDGRALSQ